MDHPDFIVCSCMVNFIGLKRVKHFSQIVCLIFSRNPEGPPVESPELSVEPFLREPDPSDIANCRNTFCFQFEQTACASSQLVGGKGSQLALLTAIQNKVLLHKV